MGDVLLLAAGESRSGGRVKESLLADAFEAVFAAITLDAGLPAAREVARRLFAGPVAELDPGRAVVPRLQDGAPGARAGGREAAAGLQAPLGERPRPPEGVRLRGASTTRSSRRRGRARRRRKPSGRRRRRRSRSSWGARRAGEAAPGEGRAALPPGTHFGKRERKAGAFSNWTTRGFDSFPSGPRKTIVGTPWMFHFVRSAATSDDALFVRSAFRRTQPSSAFATPASVKVNFSSSLQGRHQSAKKSMTTGLPAAAASASAASE